MLSVHMLKPYQPGWDEFRPRIERAAQAYHRAAAPHGIKRIGIRYINRIVIPGEQLNLGDHFALPMTVPEALPQVITRFLTRIESSYEDQPATLIVTFASLPPSESPAGRSAFVLDLDVVRSWSEEPLPVDELMVHVDDLRMRERVAFEALTTERAKEIFDAA